MLPRPSNFIAFRALALLLSVWMTCGLCGCEKPLLAPTDERSPFDRYDAVRNQYASQYIRDDRGERHPNIRERLAPRR